MKTQTRNIVVAIALVLMGAFVMFLFFRWVMAQQEAKTAQLQNEATVQGAQVENGVEMADNPAEYPVQMFFIVPTVGGEEACANTPRSVIQNTQSKDVTKVALEKLFAIKDQYYGANKLYNSLYKSNLTVQNITHTKGKTVVSLDGTFALEGTCDPPFAEVQINQTANVAARQQYGDDDQIIEINVGDKSLHEALGLR